jgi:Protein of unknown function (DUF998)
MSAVAGSTQDTRPRRQDCSTAGNITRSLLGYLVIAGPFYVLVSLAQALTRPGFDLARDEWSLLALGHLGWIQQANLILVGMMVTAGAVGVRRTISRFADAGTWLPRLLAGYGLGLIGTGIFRAGAASEAINLGFTAAVVISSAWLTIVAVDLYRRTRTADPGRTALTQPVPSPQGK